jgi:hypothetical protein
MAASTSNGKRAGPPTGDALTTITTLSPFVKSAAGVEQNVFMSLNGRCHMV